MELMLLLSFLSLLCFLVALLGVVYLVLPKRRPFDPKGRHALITGASKGIGKCIAAELLRVGCAVVTLVARDRLALETAKRELEKHAKPGQTIQIYAFDVTQGVEKIKELVKAAEAEAKCPVDLLVNNAGTCIQGAIDQLPEEAFQRQMATNYFSAVNFTLAVLPQMKATETGHISFVSSAAGQCAIWGYSAYSPSKFALRAFADVLHAELAPFHIGVSVLFPPNTETEGFREELRTMPEQIREIANSAGLFPPERVANELVASICAGHFWTCIGLDGQMLGLLTAGCSPETNPWKAGAQVLFAGYMRAVMLIYNAKFAKIIERCHQKEAVEKAGTGGEKKQT